MCGGRAADHAAAYLEGLPERRVGPAVTDSTALREALGRRLSEVPQDPRPALDELVEAAEPGLMASQSPRFCWVGPTTWRGRRAIRISVSNWATTVADVDRSCEAILAAHARAAVLGGPPPT